jgi:glutamine cyclotransferase
MALPFPRVFFLGDRIYQEIWKSGKLYEYPISNLDNVKSAAGPLSDGWGATTDQTSLILSDGSATLTWVDPATMAVQKTVSVSIAESSVQMQLSVLAMASACTLLRS